CCAATSAGTVRSAAANMAEASTRPIPLQSIVLEYTDRRQTVSVWVHVLTSVPHCTRRRALPAHRLVSSGRSSSARSRRSRARGVRGLAVGARARGRARGLGGRHTGDGRRGPGGVASGRGGSRVHGVARSGGSVG